MKIQIPPFVHSFPAPVILIGCGTVENPNIITCSWFGTVCSEPPMVSVSIRKSRYSYDPIHCSGEFSANIPKTSELDIVKYCGTKSGRDVNKFSELKITPVKCSPLKDAPMISESMISLACSVKHELELGIHNIFIAEVVSIHCEEGNVRKSMRPSPNPEDQMVYLDGKYWSLELLR